jgi:hypothetical protein
MKLKSGKELSQLEIMKRLNTMGIEYNADIIGKNYYINLYDEAIRSSVNVLKIKNDIEKDKMYSAFYNQKLRKVNECTLSLDNEMNNMNYINNNENKCNITNVNKNIGKQGFFSDFDGIFLKKLLMAQIAYNFVEVNKKNINKIGNSIPKLLIPLQAIKKYTMINIYPSIVSKINRVMDILNNLIVDKFLVISLLIFLVLIIVIFLLFKKALKNKRK